METLLIPQFTTWSVTRRGALQAMYEAQSSATAGCIFIVVKTRGFETRVIFPRRTQTHELRMFAAKVFHFFLNY